MARAVSAARAFGAFRAGGAVVALAGSAAGAAAALATAGALAATPTPTVYREGPPPGFSGGFGEQSCHACHFDSDVNDAAGTLTVSGTPARYRPGETYTLTLTLARPGMRLGGFQLSSRFAGDGSQAGAIAPAPDDADRVAVSVDRSISYAYQVAAGAEPTGADTLRWAVRWTAPDDDARVRFNVAANAADGDDSADGDFVYVAEVEVEGGGSGR